MSDQQQSNSNQTPLQAQSSREEYGQAKFWDERYQEKQTFFDWYSEFPQLKRALVLDYDLQLTDRILMVGCGNSKLSHQMYQAGFHNIISIDISEAVISQMKHKYPALAWEVMDATQMTYQDHSFDCVIDKGTLDALIAGKNYKICQAMLEECMRVTKDNGQFIEITYGSPEGRRGIFRHALPFHQFDYYYSQADLNDMSTMINLMRGNLQGKKLGNILTEKDALQKTMRDFAITKMIRKNKKYQKQYVVWTSHPKHKATEFNQTNIHEIETKQILNTEDKVDIQTEDKVDIQTEEDRSKIVEKSPEGEGYHQKKQTFVYVYSIRRKLAFNLEEIQQKYQEEDRKLQKQLILPGDQKLPMIFIRTSSANFDAINIAVRYLEKKRIPHSTVVACIGKKEKNSFCLNLSSCHKSNLIQVLHKSQIEVSISQNKKGSFKEMMLIQKQLMAVCDELTEACNLHPCPKTYELFSMLKSRVPGSTISGLLKKYWYPTFQVTSIDSECIRINLSYPPLNQSSSNKLLLSLQAITKQKDWRIVTGMEKIGFISYVSVELVNLLNMASISYNGGEKMELLLVEFGEGEKQFEEYGRQGEIYNEWDETIDLKDPHIEHILVHVFSLL